MIVIMMVKTFIIRDVHRGRLLEDQCWQGGGGGGEIIIVQILGIFIPLVIIDCSFDNEDHIDTLMRI